jgi:hypothetical protein
VRDFGFGSSYTPYTVNSYFLALARLGKTANSAFALKRAIIAPETRHWKQSFYLRGNLFASPWIYLRKRRPTAPGMEHDQLSFN